MREDPERERIEDTTGLEHVSEPEERTAMSTRRGDVVVGVALAVEAERCAVGDSSQVSSSKSGNFCSRGTRRVSITSKFTEHVIACARSFRRWTSAGT